MDDEYDAEYDDLDSDSDFDDDIDDTFDDTEDSDDNVASGRDLNELEDLGMMDGQQDAVSGTFYAGYGLSVDDLDSLSAEEKDAYEMGYHTGFGAGGGW